MKHLPAQTQSPGSRSRRTPYSIRMSSTSSSVATLKRARRRAMSSRINYVVSSSSGSTSGSGHLDQDPLHLGGCESTHCLRADVAQQVRCQQHAGGRLVVRSFEDANLVILTERPIHLLDAYPHRLHLGGPGGHPLGRLLGGLDTLVGELHQTNVRRHDITPPSKAEPTLLTPSVKCVADRVNDCV